MQKILDYKKIFIPLQSLNMVSVVQLVERQIVVLVVVGSSPTVHPAKRVSLRIDSFFVYAPEKFMTGFQNMFQE